MYLGLTNSMGLADGVNNLDILFSDPPASPQSLNLLQTLKFVGGVLTSTKKTTARMLFRQPYPTPANIHLTAIETVKGIKYQITYSIQFSECLLDD